MIYENSDILLFKRHSIKLVYIYWKFILLFNLFMLLLFVIISYREKLKLYENSLFYWSIILILLLLINTAVIILIIDLITYYNSLVIISDDNIIIIQNTLLIREDIEIINIPQLTKVNIERHWLFSHLLWYWNLILEQQRAEVCPLFFTPEPYRIINYIKKRMWNNPFEIMNYNS